MPNSREPNYVGTNFCHRNLGRLELRPTSHHSRNGNVTHFYCSIRFFIRISWRQMIRSKYDALVDEEWAKLFFPALVLIEQPSQPLLLNIEQWRHETFLNMHKITCRFSLQREFYWSQLSFAFDTWQNAEQDKKEMSTRPSNGSSDERYLIELLECLECFTFLAALNTRLVDIF